MQKISNHNRRFLAFPWKEEILNFALWRQKIGNLLAQSGKLQRVDDCLYLEFKGCELLADFMVGVDVIGMEPALPHDNIHYIDYDHQEWERFELPAELPESLSKLRSLCLSLIKDFSQDIIRLRICQKVLWNEDVMQKVNYLDLLISE